MRLHRVNISIGELFDKLGINNEKYEKVQKVKNRIYIRNTNEELVPILGYVKKRVNLVKYTFKNEIGCEYTLTCSDKHILIDRTGANVYAKDADHCINLYDGQLNKVQEEVIGEGDGYDIAIKAPHLYYTSNGIIHHNTTLSRIMANYGDNPLFINASLERGIDTIRDKVITYASASSLFGGEERLKVVVLEECDNLTADAWASLRATIEQFASSCRFIANCNYIDKVPEPIQSRFNCIPIEPVNTEEEEYLLKGYIERVTAILRALKITFKNEDVQQFVKNDFPDMRSLIKKIQQLYTRGIRELSAETLGTSFDCSDIFEIIMKPGNAWENYKALSGKWANKAEDAVLMIGQKFPEYLQTIAPSKMVKLPLIVLSIAEYNAQLATSIDKFITLLALVYKLQIIVNQ